ncbi:MAG TPA: GntG family PLP-dependent aldolase [Streptosporangiaceae bacterium]|nr:GntG family PLP-dependent aldolase [Streptosporangiaceae bacterium]
MISYYDTSTLPTQEMLDAIAAAPLGDDVYGEDPTVNELEAVAAGLMGKDSAVLMPSGTMANLAAVLSWTRPADEVVVEAEAHLLYYEAGGISGVAGCVPLGVPGERGVLRAEEVERHLRSPDLHYPVTRLLCVENTHNRAGGTVTPVAVMKELRELCDSRGLALHVDGARIFNASVALDIPVADLVADADSVSFALSKGLSAPVGALLAGSAEFVGRARRARKMLGGGMRQAGIIAAAGLVALRTGIGRLREDHEQARRLAAKLAGLPGLRVSPEAVQSNFVMVDAEQWGIGAERLVAELAARGIAAAALPPHTVRFVTHRLVGAQEADTLAAALREIGRC